jgi:hypothetical protein
VVSECNPLISKVKLVKNASFAGFRFSFGEVHGYPLSLMENNRCSRVIGSSQSLEQAGRKPGNP